MLMQHTIEGFGGIVLLQFVLVRHMRVPPTARNYGNEADVAEAEQQFVKFEGLVHLTGGTPARANV